MLEVAKRFSNQTLHLIASHGTTDDTRRHRQSETSSSSVIWTYKDGKHRIGKATCILVDAIEIRFVMEALRRSERPGDRLQESSIVCGEKLVRRPDQTLRRLRPLARRRASTARPERVAMRARNP